MEAWLFGWPSSRIFSRYLRSFSHSTRMQFVHVRFKEPFRHNPLCVNATGCASRVRHLAITDKRCCLNTMASWLTRYRRRDPKASDEEEYLENLFDVLCTCLMQPHTRAMFYQQEGALRHGSPPSPLLNNVCRMLERQGAEHCIVPKIGIGLSIVLPMALDLASPVHMTPSPRLPHPG